MPNEIVVSISTVLYSIGICFVGVIFIYVGIRLATAAFYRSRKEFK